MPEESRQSLGGIQSGSIEFEVEFSNVNGDQQIEAPAQRAAALRADDVTGRGAARFRGLGGGVAGDHAHADPRADGTSPEAQDFKDYADCLDKARPEDTEALQRCAELLQRP